MKRIRVELPPLTEVWDEVSCLSANPLWRQAVHLPRRERVEGLALMVKHVRMLISLEEVYGKGLLRRFNASQGLDYFKAGQLDSPVPGSKSRSRH